jgi:hypothetical protein
MTKSRIAKPAIEIARDGFERFTGWAHRILNFDDVRDERLATPRQYRGHEVAVAIATKTAEV